MNAPYLLPAEPEIPSDLQRRVQEDYDRFAQGGLPKDLESFLLENYQLDVRSTYAGLPIKNPWGKASGQLSMTLPQVEEDVAAGLGFVVLKTVIAEDDTGGKTMAAWAIQESKMVVEPITGERGDTGWTVTWKGRGWWQSFDAYLDLVRRATELGQQHGTVIVPSCKYHLPAPGESTWRTAEYEYTTRKIRDASPLTPLPIEKDFSPTLAGSELSKQKEQILSWLQTVPGLIRAGAGSRPIRIGLKLFNALFDDEFQLEMLRQVLAAAGPNRADFVVYGNRLIDTDKVFEGKRGIAYGGPDLSDRNLRVLDLFQAEVKAAKTTAPLMEMSATGNIHSGKMAVEYALRGCTSFQMHTLFQLPASEYVLRSGSKTEKALHRLYFHPTDGFVVWMHHLAGKMELRDTCGIIRLVSLRRRVVASEP